MRREDDELADVGYSTETSDRLAPAVALVLAALALGWDATLLGPVVADVATRSPGVTGCAGAPTVWAEARER